MTAIEKARFYVVGDVATFQKNGVDPQEVAMFAGNIDSAVEDPKTYGTIAFRDKKKQRYFLLFVCLIHTICSETVETLRGRWRSFYENVAEVLQGTSAPLVSLASVRRAVAVLDAALQSVKTKQPVSVDIPANTQ